MGKRLTHCECGKRIPDTLVLAGKTRCLECARADMIAQANGHRDVTIKPTRRDK
jgi:hypothetical protein